MFMWRGSAWVELCVRFCFVYICVCLFMYCRMTVGYGFWDVCIVAGYFGVMGFSFFWLVGGLAYVGTSGR